MIIYYTLIAFTGIITIISINNIIYYNSLYESQSFDVISKSQVKTMYLLNYFLGLFSLILFFVIIYKVLKSKY